MKEKIKTTSFWLEISGVLVIVADAISTAFGLNLYSEVLKTCLMTLGSILVVIGVITKKNVADDKTSTKEELLDEFDIDENEK